MRHNVTCCAAMRRIAIRQSRSCRQTPGQRENIGMLAGKMPSRRLARSARAVVMTAVAGIAVACGGSGSSTTAPAASSPAGAATAPAASSSAPVVSPSPTGPAPVDWSAQGASQVFVRAFARVAHGRGVARAAVYKGYRHPLVFIGRYRDDDPWNQTVEFQWQSNHRGKSALRPKFVTEVQLVAYVTEREQHLSCGSYEGSDGKVGRLLRTEADTTVSIIVARTGQTIATRTFTDLPNCPASYMEVGDPPWLIPGSVPAYYSDDAVTNWVNSFLKGPVQ